jgi:hypothetical protein
VRDEDEGRRREERGSETCILNPTTEYLQYSTKAQGAGHMRESLRRDEVQLPNEEKDLPKRENRAIDATKERR